MSKLKKFKRNKMYHITWKDHSTCYNNWVEVKDMDLVTDFPCETVGFFVGESKTCIFLSLSKYVDKNRDTHCSVMQILKSTITKSKEVK